jgi:NTE family protein
VFLFRLLVWALIAIPVHAAAADAARPRVGLVLSGGGARGAAHIGVLKVLEAERIPIDAVAGTSMGAVVGGLYASGLTATEIDAALQSVNWREAFSDRPPRDELSFRRKEEDRKFLLRLPIGVRGGEFRLPRGLIPGQQLNEALRSLTIPVATVKDFDALPTPFRAVATDLVSGERVVLASGDLTTAMRASLSLPGVFVPVETDGRLLVDGGLTDNVPVDVARAMGVDVLIVVDVGFPLQARNRLTSAPSITNQMLAILIRRNSEAQVATLGASDVLIDPQLGDASSFDFSRFGATIALGEDAVRSVAPRLAALALPESQYEQYVARRATGRGAPLPMIATVRAAPDSERYEAPIDALFGGFAGKPLDPPAVAARVTELYGEGNLEMLDYRVVANDDGADGLLITARRNSWGPNYVRFGLSLGDDFEGNSSFNAAARVVLADINSLGAEWTWDLQIGETPVLATEFYQPLSFLHPWFVSPQVRLQARNVPLFDSAGQRVATYRVRSNLYGADIGYDFGNIAQLRVGYRWQDGTSTVQVGDPLLPSDDFDVRQFVAGFAYDTLDSIGFPRGGSTFAASWIDEEPTSGSSDAAELAAFDWQIARSRGRNTGLLWLSAGSNYGSDPPQVRNLYPLGGFLRLSGLAPEEIAGPTFAIARLVYYRQIGRGGGGFLDFPAYVGTSYEVGNVWATRSEVSWDSARQNYSLFFGLDTLLGPLYIGGGYDEDGSTAYFLTLGRVY